MPSPIPTPVSTTCPFANISLHHTSDALHLQSPQLLTTLSSSFYGGGFRRVRHILNAYVAADYCSRRPAHDLQAIAAACGIHAPFVGLLTAVPLHRARSVFLEEQGLQVGVVATAGVGNATSAGVSLPFVATPGTINLILLLDARLSRAAMVNAIITATEAKSALLGEMDIRTAQGALATGTSTDTVTVAITGRGPVQVYAGPATLAGYLLGRAVRQAVRESLLAP